MREDEEIRALGPITVPAPRVENRPPVTESPNQTSPRRIDTPQTSPPAPGTPGLVRTDPNYIPQDTPRSRRDLSTSRQDPLTLLRTRCQNLKDTLEEEIED
jgi:hypothetical protein